MTGAVQMTKRKLLIALTAAVLGATGLFAFALPASAELRSFRVTLLGGRQLTVTLDVAPGTPHQPDQDPGRQGSRSSSIQEIPPLAGRDREPAGSASARGRGAAEPPRQAAGRARGRADPPRARPPPREPTRRSPARRRPRLRKSKLRHADGTPTKANPTYSLALPGPAPIGVPNFFIEKFRIPPFLLPIYQAAGIEYGVRWEILAAINEIETDYGRNLNVSTAGAVGWMQFLPSTWQQVRRRRQRRQAQGPVQPGRRDLRRRALPAGRGRRPADMRQAIFAYNHADWYVDSVLLRARLIGGLPADLVGSITGLTQGHFPVHAKARYADDISERDAQRRVAKGHNAAMPVTANPTRRGINIYAKSGSPVVAVQDGKVVNRGWAPRLGRFIQLRDVYGNTYTYGHLAKIVDTYPVPKPRTESRARIARELKLPKRDAAPTAPGERRQAGHGERDQQAKAEVRRSPPTSTPPSISAHGEERQGAPLRAPVAPERPRQRRRATSCSRPASRCPAYTTFKSYFTQVFGLNRADVVIKPLKKGSPRHRRDDPRAHRQALRHGPVSPHVLFEIRPAGRGAPRIDPKPILDGWKLLETTAIYRASGKNPFFGPDARKVTIGQILLMSKEALSAASSTTRGSTSTPAAAATSARARSTAACWRRSSSSPPPGLSPRVTSLKCGHSFFTKSGNVSEHTSGNAVDIAKINGIPILGHQGPGSITDITVRRLLTLQGTISRTRSSP